uniref:Metallo-beta-lactamase domain-containing protein n=1 Tax=Amphimedon queenslandica TaxID=400682 RepID=A0A1X7UDQ7_AMPQE
MLLYLLLCLLASFPGAVPHMSLPQPDDNLNIYALPVGQGDSTVIQCPLADNGTITIIDAGSSKSTGFTKYDFVNYLKGQSIKYVILTHADTDHVKYIDPLLQMHDQPVTIYHSCSWSKYRSKVRSANTAKFRVTKCCGLEGCNFSLPLCPNSKVVLNVIGSEYNNCKKGTNGDSIVSIIKYQNISTLITGDFEGSKRFMRSYLSCVGNDPVSSDLRADIYRLSHHGAYNGKANTEDFLKAVNASYVFSSSGLKSNYKHPRCELYDHYKGKLTIDDTKHSYTCYMKDGTTASYYTGEGIYVTTVIEDEIVKNYVVKFSIDDKGSILPRAILFRK